MNAHINITGRPANAKPWPGAMIYTTELDDKAALKPDAYVVSDVTESAFKVDRWPHWLPFSRVDYLLPDFTTCSGDSKDRTIHTLHERLTAHRAQAKKYEPVSHSRHSDWEAACIAANVWDGPTGRVIPRSEHKQAQARRDELAEETGYKAARDAWQYETMMAYLIEEAIFTIPANTPNGLAIQSQIALCNMFDVEDINGLDENDTAKFAFSERRFIGLAKAADRVARQQTGTDLGDLDLSVSCRGAVDAGIGQQAAHSSSSKLFAFAEAAKRPASAKVTIDDLESDITHLDHLMECIVDQVQDLDCYTFEDGSRNTALDRVAALVWIARDLTNRAVTDVAGVNSGVAAVRAAAAKAA